MFNLFCAREDSVQETESTMLPAPEQLRRSISHSNHILEENGGYIGGPRLSIIPTLPSNEPLELLALTNEAICDRDALLACKRLSELSKDLTTLWMREQFAQCSARALLVFSDVFPCTSKFPPTEAFLVSIPADEPVIVAVIAHHRRKSEILSPTPDDLVDGLESFPVTYFKAQPNAPCTREFHAEAVMLCDVAPGETRHVQDNRMQSSVAGQSSLPSAAKRNHKPATYFARRLYDNLVVVVHFPRSNREANDVAVSRLLDRLSRLFVL